MLSSSSLSFQAKERSTQQQQQHQQKSSGFLRSFLLLRGVIVVAIVSFLFLQFKTATYHHQTTKLGGSSSIYYDYGGGGSSSSGSVKRSDGEATSSSISHFRHNKGSSSGRAAAAAVATDDSSAPVGKNSNSEILTTGGTPKPLSVAARTGVKQNSTQNNADPGAQNVMLPPLLEISRAAQTQQYPQQLPLCTREQVRQGRWVPKQYERLPYLPRQRDSKTCYTPQDLHRLWNSYEWQPDDAASLSSPSSCEFTQWNQDLFCSLARNQTIAILGDSTSLEHYSALVHSLGVTDFMEETTFDKKNPQLRFEYHVCSPNNNGTTTTTTTTTRLLFYRNNWLFPTSIRNFLRDPVNNPIDIMILNRGSWYADDDALLRRLKQLIPYIQSWVERCRQRQQQQQQYNDSNSNSSSYCMAIWRTTVPGHAYCLNFTKPATTTTTTAVTATTNNSMADMEAWILDPYHYTKTTSKFHWYDFAHQNKLVLKTLNETHLEHSVMDAYEINVLRGDDHVARSGKKDDCLHNCQPSSTTLVYNQLLLHLMMQKQNEASGGHRWNIIE